MEYADVTSKGGTGKHVIITGVNNARMYVPLQEKDISKIIATPTPPPPCSDLPSFPFVPFLLHPHRPLLLWCSFCAVHAYDFANNRWEAGGPQQLQPQLQQLHRLPISAADCICLQCGARSSSLRDSSTLSKEHAVFRQRDAHTSTCPNRQTAPTVTVPGYKCNRKLACAAASGGSLAQDSVSNHTLVAVVSGDTSNAGVCSATSISSAQPNIAAETPSECVWVTAGEDKYIHFVEVGSYKLLRSRLQRKKLSAAVFLGCSSVPVAAPPKEGLTANKDASLQQKEEMSTSSCSSGAVQEEEQQQRPAAHLLLADKFGDVYLLGDSLGAPPEQALAGDLLSKTMRTLPSVHGVRVAAAAAEGVPPLFDGFSDVSERLTVETASAVLTCGAAAGGSAANNFTATSANEPRQLGEKRTALTPLLGAAASTTAALEQPSEIVGELADNVSISRGNLRSRQEGGDISSLLLRGGERDTNRRSLVSSIDAASIQGKPTDNNLQSQAATSVVPTVAPLADATDTATYTTVDGTSSEADIFAASRGAASPVLPRVTNAEVQQGARGSPTRRLQPREGEGAAELDTHHLSEWCARHQQECLVRGVGSPQPKYKEERTLAQNGEKERFEFHSRDQRFRENAWQRERARLWRQQHVQTTLMRERQQQQTGVDMHTTAQAGLQHMYEESDENGSSESGPMDIPLLSHLTTVTVMKVFSDTPSCPRTSPTQSLIKLGSPPTPQLHLGSGREGGADLLLTADRDEKVRVCLVDQPWSIESFYLGHSEFVTDFVMITDGCGRKQGRLRAACADCNNSNSGEEVTNVKRKRSCAVPQSCRGTGNCRGARGTGPSTKDCSCAGEATAAYLSRSDADMHLQSREKILLCKVGISAAADGTLQAWRVSDGAQLDVLSLIPENLFGNRRGDLSYVLSCYEGASNENRDTHTGERRAPLSPEQLLPASLLFDEDQRLLLVRCLKLRGLLLIPVEQEETMVFPPWVAPPSGPRLGRQPFFIPFPMVPAAILLLYHSLEELIQTPALADAAQALQSLLFAGSIADEQKHQPCKKNRCPSCVTDMSACGVRPSEEHDSRFTPLQRKPGSVLPNAPGSVPFVWWIDEKGRLRSPICTSVPLLRRVQGGHLQEVLQRGEARSGKLIAHAIHDTHILPCVEGCSLGLLGMDYGASELPKRALYILHVLMCAGEGKLRRNKMYGITSEHQMYHKYCRFTVEAPRGKECFFLTQR